jgi:hypothetical protein
MWRVYGGAIAGVAGIAAFIEANRHKPVQEVVERYVPGGPTHVIQPALGLSPSAYDLIRVGGWALVILGGLTVILGLIRYWRAT